MPGLVNGAGQYGGAGRYNKLELKRLHEALESHYYHDEGLSRGEAHKKAEEMLIQKTGQSLSGPFGPGVLSPDSPERDPPRRHTGKHYRNTPVRETDFERRFYGTKPYDGSRGGNGDQHGASARVLSTAQIKAATKAVFEEWLDKGASEDYARQQADEFYIREAGKAHRAAAADASRRPQPSRSSAFDDFSSMGDALDDDEGYGSRSSGPSRGHSTRGHRAGAPRPPGWEDSQFDEYFTDEPQRSRGPSRGRSYYDDDDDDVPRFETRQGFSSSSNGYEDDFDDDTSYGGPRGYRTEKRRPGGSSSPLGGFDGTYDDYESPPSSRRGPCDYRTEERRPSGFSSSYFSHGPEEYSSGYRNRGQGARPGSRRSQRPMNVSGIKPAEDLYVTLGVPASASAESLKLAHRKLSIKHHPDRETGGVAAKKKATDRMAQINQAFDVLKDGQMREFYDRTGLIASKGLLP
ncbi:hypothetical protein N0V95_002574 [Ascochyta clinopodiicola]|nr:hypothetical protein N0V95_002574 [Ascochyta clinopodiicola]